MLRWRLLLGAVFIAALAGLCWLDARQALGAAPGLWLFPLAILLALAASGEMLWMLANRQIQPHAAALYVGSLAIVASNGVPLYWPDYPPNCPLGRLGWPLCTFGVAVLAAFVVEMARYRAPGKSVVQLAATVLSFAYVGLLLSFLIQLRAIDVAEGQQTGQWGLVALVSLVAVVKVADIGAYTVGRLVGRHKMTPLLSPGKTWEGAVGAIVFAAIAAWLVRALWVKQDSTLAVAANAPLIAWLSYGVLIGMVGLLGDLAESLVKRDLGRKDSSAWMPGFGGVLDLLDSILFAAPVAYLCWAGGLLP
ncbi:MAG: CDP-archaeol synthase [Pirellulales bacterium]